MMTVRLPLETCLKCGRIRTATGGSLHATHYDNQMRLVDCVGDPVPEHMRARAVVEEYRGRVDGVPVPTVQEQQLERVAEKIAAAILSFAKPGRRFHADELRQHVEEACGKLAPGSADRVLRDLRARGLVAYRCTNRKESSYEIGGTP